VVFACIFETPRTLCFMLQQERCCSDFSQVCGKILIWEKRRPRPSTFSPITVATCVLRVIYTAMPDTTKLSCLCRVRFGGVNWIPDDSGLSPTENLKSEHVSSIIVQFTALRQTRHRQDCFIVSGGRCELGIRSTAPQCSVVWVVDFRQVARWHRFVL